MLCNICKQKEAKVHFTQIVENEVKKVDLCEGCAKEKGLNDATTFAIADMLLGLGASQQMSDAGNAKGGDLKCAACGFTQADFKKTARLGCAECYEVFQEGLESILKSMHKGTQHKGKVPQALRKAQDQMVRIARLEKDLQSAVSREDFEQAAVIRDQLKAARAAGSGA